MRAILLLSVLALASAGCASPGEDSTGSTPGASTSDTGTPNEVHLAHDHTDGEDETLTFTLDATAAYDLEIGFREREGAPACAGVGTRVVVKSPTGEVIAEAEASNLQSPCAGTGSDQGSKTLKAGDYTVEFTGRGAIVGFVDIVPA